MGCARTIAQRHLTAVRLVVVILVAGALLCGGLSCGVDVTTPESKLKIIDKHFVTTEYSAEVWGLAKNVSGRELKSPMVIVQMLDDKGDVLYQWADRIHKLGPDEVWRFEVRYEQGDATDYKILYRSVLHVG
jgi:hypothetical protein